MKRCRRKDYKGKLPSYGSLMLAILLFNITAIAQDGIAGINDANTKVRSYYVRRLGYVEKSNTVPRVLKHKTESSTCVFDKGNCSIGGAGTWKNLFTIP